jgi:hypothetical protein
MLHHKILFFKTIFESRRRWTIMGDCRKSYFIARRHLVVLTLRETAGDLRNDKSAIFCDPKNGHQWVYYWCRCDKNWRVQVDLKNIMVIFLKVICVTNIFHPWNHARVESEYYYSVDDVRIEEISQWLNCLNFHFCYNSCANFFKWF